MTVSTTTCKVTYTGNGADTTFTYGFEVPIGSDFSLTLLDTTTGVQTVLSTALYSVSGLGNASGGSFTYPLSGGTAIPSTQTLTFLRELPFQQTTNLGNQGNYYPQAVEAALDEIVLQIQQLNEAVGRCIKQPACDGTALSELPAAFLRKNTKLTFDNTGQISLVAV